MLQLEGVITPSGAVRISPLHDRLVLFWADKTVWSMTPSRATMISEHQYGIIMHMMLVKTVKSSVLERFAGGLPRSAWLVSCCFYYMFFSSFLIFLFLCFYHLWSVECHKDGAGRCELQPAELRAMAPGPEPRPAGRRSWKTNENELKTMDLYGKIWKYSETFMEIHGNCTKSWPRL